MKSGEMFYFTLLFIQVELTMICSFSLFKVAPKIMRTAMSKMPLMVALDDESPKQSVPLTVRSDCRTRINSTKVAFLLLLFHIGFLFIYF